MKLSKKYLEEAKCVLSTPTPEQVVIIESKKAISPSPILKSAESPIPPPPPTPPKSVESPIPPPPPTPPKSAESPIPPPPPTPPKSAESDIALEEELSKDYPAKSPVKSISLVGDQIDPEINIPQSTKTIESLGSVSKEILICDSILKSGPRKGQKCGKSAKIDGKCNVHNKTPRVSSDEIPPPPPTPPIKQVSSSPPLEEEIIPPPPPTPPIEQVSSSPPLEEEIPPPPSPPIETELVESWPVVQIEEKDLLNILKKTKVMNIDTIQMNFLQQELDKIFS
jgi:hypothetical protein